MTHALLAQFADQPVMFTGEQMGQVKAYLDAGMKHADFDKLMSEPQAAADDGFWPEAGNWMQRYRPYDVVDGVLQIQVKGVLLKDFPFMAGWATGYEYIQRAFQRGMDDGTVRGIALICHSPGGLVAGNQDLVDRMYARRDEKPVRAFASEAAYSAAYNIFSVAPIGYVTRTGGVGSIGVRMTHVSWTKFNENMGLDYTFIFAGEGKVDGDPDAPLSAEAKARMQERIDELYDVFVSSVARNRGLDEDAIRKEIKAHSYSATKAVSLGLADQIGSLDDAVAAFAAELSSTSGDETMSTQDNTATVEQAVHEQAVAAARTEGELAGAKAAQERISAILGAEEATGRETLAQHFAFKSDMSAEAAVAALAVSPKAEPAAPEGKKDESEAEGKKTPFDAAMETGNPDIGGNGGKKDGEETHAEDASADILALIRSNNLPGFSTPASK